MTGRKACSTAVCCTGLFIVIVLHAFPSQKEEKRETDREREREKAGDILLRTVAHVKS